MASFIDMESIDGYTFLREARYPIPPSKNGILRDALTQYVKRKLMEAWQVVALPVPVPAYVYYRTEKDWYNRHVKGVKLVGFSIEDKARNSEWTRKTEFVDKCWIHSVEPCLTSEFFSVTFAVERGPSRKTWFRKQYTNARDLDPYIHWWVGRNV